MQRQFKGRLASGLAVIGLTLAASPAVRLAPAAGAPRTSREPERAAGLFAGGCFWCEETAFEGLPGVVSVTSGYTGGTAKDPSYEDVSSGVTGHAESVEVVFDPTRISYVRLLEVFWHSIDPLQRDGQFCDHGSQYRSAIFYRAEAQRKAAEDSKSKLEEDLRFKGKIATQIVPASIFYRAEEYHQDFYKKDPVRYHAYRAGCGRDARLEELWSVPTPQKARWPGSFKKPSDEELRRRLTPLQYEVTQKESTERAFNNEYWDNNRAGIYVDIVSGEPLFSSLDKYDSGTGWPSFSSPLESANVKIGTDYRVGLPRTEVRSAHADSHLGHVFDDGPPPNGLRYCMNSAAMRFVGAEDLVKEGYGQYRKLFDEPKK